ncbi:3-oxoacyl-[acyl-carrier protein] reductase [Armatimonadetes bacterium GBS]|jgi:3-oxoacyl-[acyl-carrier protein] reductase|nr:3-oxoacyl-[acyl-carrier-protein] reductase FabG [bacterium HR14]GIV13775.1 MAG: 3-oxoacyl-(ACP) reductase [Fimbriimonadales bacterium]CUU01054.1 3-oxoacyl-[acyl-carrier protein] reductase [Armatimonadetes bacterium GBS]CUU34316.1 3-oxoacyl-[acyl-carrier protein] reductase [Armatimonadetes bacterium GXS]
MTNFSGRVAVITGAAKGIGRAMAEQFAQRGAKVALLDVDIHASLQAADAIRQRGGEALALFADVSDMTTLQQAASEVQKAYGKTDILCCNAGIYPQAFLETMSEADWDRVHAVNLRGMFLTIKAFLPMLRQSPCGRIILTSSITGPITGFPGWAHYGATKAGMIGFMHSAAIELAKYGITVNAILPGNIETEGLGEIGEEYRRKMEAMIPFKRLGKPEDVACAALFFASDEASYITGQTLVVDGGQVLPESSLALEDL